MIGRNAAWRCGGVCALAAAAGTSLLHRSVLAAHIHGPASGLELILGLTSFALASAGVLLLIHGARLRDDWVRDCSAENRVRTPEPSIDAGAEPDAQDLNMSAPSPYARYGCRAELAMFLANRAIRAEADDRTHSSQPADIMKAGHSS